MLLTYEVALRNGLIKAREKVVDTVKDFFTDENGDTNMISIILVLVIVIALAALFRKNIAAMVTAMWTDISNRFNGASGTNADIGTTFE